MPLPLTGKRALVTGGSHRIGRSIAQSLAAAGADVAITFRSSSEAAEQMARELSAHGVEAMAVHCDVRDPLCVTEAVSAVTQKFGGLDLLINNAGAFETVALEQITPQQWDAMFETNTRGPFLVAQAAYPHLKASQGRIINI